MYLFFFLEKVYRSTNMHFFFFFFFFALNVNIKVSFDVLLPPYFEKALFKRWLKK